MGAPLFSGPPLTPGLPLQTLQGSHDTDGGNDRLAGTPFSVPSIPTDVSSFLFPQPPWQVVDLLIPILQVRKLSLREVDGSACGHKAAMQPSWQGGTPTSVTKAGE